MRSRSSISLSESRIHGCSTMGLVCPKPATLHTTSVCSFAELGEVCTRLSAYDWLCSATSAFDFIMCRPSTAEIAGWKRSGCGFFDGEAPVALVLEKVTQIVYLQEFHVSKPRNNNIMHRGRHFDRIPLAVFSFCVVSQPLIHHRDAGYIVQEYQAPVFYAA